jgi:hypothetical protein
MDDAPQLKRKVAGAGIEPVTHGFSVAALTTEPVCGDTEFVGDNFAKWEIWK